MGIRQASLYYHFESKEQILAELLEATVRPSLDHAAELARQGLTPAAALHALAMYDVGVLLTARWNVGILYALPEVATEPFARFRDEREQLRLVYRKLAAAATTTGDREPAGDQEVTGDLVLGLVESVIGMRRDLPVAPSPQRLQRAVATAVLRLVGADLEESPKGR